MKSKVSTSLLTCILLWTASCEEFIAIDPPVSDLVRTTVFSDDETAERAILGIYSQLASNIGFAWGDVRGVSYTASLSSDELVNYNIAFEMSQFNNNTLLSGNSIVLSLWSTLYQTIYRANSIVEGLNSSTTVSQAVKIKLIGEAKFIRAFCYFYLVNLWGDVPLVLTTDYRTNTNMARTNQLLVYEQIIKDLDDAQTSLPNITKAKLHPYKETAAALLARVYLYRDDWKKAETMATTTIESVLALESNLDNVFLTTSSEAIWQLASDKVNGQEGRTFIFTSLPVNGALRQSLVESFEANDLRRTKWIGSTMVDNEQFFFPNKYKVTSNTPVTEYSVVMRLAEQYLRRAEARAQLGMLEDAKDDLNVIRARAELPTITASTKEEILSAIARERKAELFTEWGHRWLDLKRTNHLNEILDSIKPDWEPTAALYPIPDLQIINNPNMASAQNPGY